MKNDNIISSEGFVTELDKVIQKLKDLKVSLESILNDFCFEFRALSLDDKYHNVLK